MITAEKLQELISYTPEQLMIILGNTGFHGIKITHAEFVGITNGGQFAYKIVTTDGWIEEITKVFVDYNHPSGNITADF